MAARGRPSAPISIVPNVLAFNALLLEGWNLKRIHNEVTTDIDVCIRWMAERRLLKNVSICQYCPGNVNMKFISRGDREDGKQWYCSARKSHKSIRYGSFFADSHLTLCQCIEIFYWWTLDVPNRVIMMELNIKSDHTIIDWNNFIRIICSMWLEDDREKVGGVDANGVPLVVEIDECEFFHRKYHRGQWREGSWVFGGIERGSNRTFMVDCSNNKRDAESLLPLIQEWIEPGTRIISDMWAAYGDIDALSQGYLHATVNHRYNFVNPNDETIHTNRIEGTWMCAKRKFKRMNGTNSEEMFSTYLNEFMFKRAHNNKHIFENLVYWTALYW